MFFNAGQTEGAIGAVMPEKSSVGSAPNRNLSPEQFGKPKTSPEAGAGEAGAAEGAGAEAGAGAVAEEALPLLLL